MKNKVYIRLIITYLAVFLIPLFVNILMLEDIRQATQDNICESVRMNLSHAASALENNLQEIDTIVANLSASSNVRYIATQMDEQDKKVEISKILTAQDYMGVMRIQNLVEEYYLYFHESNMIISPDHIYLDQESCQYFFRYGDLTWEEWETLMKKSYSNYLFQEETGMQNKQSQKMLLYVQSLVTDSGTKGNFIFPIKSKLVEELLSDTYIANAGWAYLTDAEGRILLSMSSQKGEFEAIPTKSVINGSQIQEMKLNGREVVSIQSTPTKKGLSFVAVLPKEYITARINQAQENTFRIMIIGLVIGFLCILVMSWYRGRSINKILHLLFNIGTDQKVAYKGDEMTYISNSLKQLIKSSADMEENIKKQEPITRGLLIERLLRGSDSVVDKSLEEYGIYLNNKKLLVIAFLFDSNGGDAVGEYASEIIIYKQILQKGLASIFSGKQYLCDTDINAGAIICAMEEHDEAMGEIMYPAIEKLADLFWEEYGMRLRLAVSNICKDISQINKAYDQIYEILQYGASSGKNVFFYEDYCKSREYYYYPTPLEERLVNAVRMGNAQSTHLQLTELYQVNVMESSISPSMMHFLVNDLQCTVFKALHGLAPNIHIQAEEIYKQLEELNHEHEILLRFNRINNIFKYICEKVQEENNSNSTMQKQKIEEYIQTHYSSSDMSLTKIADDFGYVSTYFSKLFKELFQENFAAYLEKVRIEKVCQLLKEDRGETLESICLKTGYNSVYVMRTAFKRNKGVTPNDYRKINEGE